MTKCQISWDSYQQNLLSGFAALQQRQEFVDMTIAAAGHLVKVHKNILALASPYLKEMIQSIPCDHPAVFLSNIEADTLTQLLEYIYTGEVVVPKDRMEIFTKVCKDLKIIGAPAFYPVKDRVIKLLKNTNAEQPQHKTPATNTHQKSTKTHDNPKLNLEMNTYSILHTDYEELIDTGFTEDDALLNSKSGTNTETQDQHHAINSFNPNPPINMNCPNQMTLFPVTEQTSNMHIDEINDIFSVNNSNSNIEPSNSTNYEVVSGYNNNMFSININPTKETLNNNKVPDPTLSIETANIPVSSTNYSFFGNDVTLVKNCNSDAIVVEDDKNGGINHYSEEEAIERNSIQNFNSNATSKTAAKIPEAVTKTTFDKPETNYSINVQFSDGDTEPPKITIVPGSTKEKASSLNKPAKVTSKEIALQSTSPLYIVSNRGKLQMILNRFLYNLHHHSTRHKLWRWRCVDYRRIQCLAYLDTQGDTIIGRKNAHKHEFHDKRILSKGNRRNVFSSLKEIEEIINKPTEELPYCDLGTLT